MFKVVRSWQKLYTLTIIIMFVESINKLLNNNMARQEFFINIGLLFLIITGIMGIFKEVKE